jgi:hypothetical protein
MNTATENHPRSRPPKKTAAERWHPIDSKLATPAPLKTVAEIAAAKKEAGSEKFPATFKESLVLLQKLSTESVKGQKDWAEKQPRLEALKRHVHEIQQGLPVIPTTANQQIVGVLRDANAPELRRARMEALQVFLRCDEPVVKSSAPYDFKQDPKSRLMQEPEVLESLWRCRLLLAQAELFELENFDLANPLSRIHELETAIQTANDLATLRGFQAELSIIRRSDGRQLGNRVAEIAIVNAFNPALKEIATLLNICRELFHSWAIAARAREEDFFAAYELPTQQTSLSVRYEEAGKHLPTISKASLDYFGITDATIDPL